MKLSDNKGFTLVEILVAINLAFITITLILSFYLFSSRFFFSTVKKMEESSHVNSFMINFERLLEKSESYEFLVQNDSAYFIFDDSRRIVFSSGGISLYRDRIIAPPDKYFLSITGDSLSSVSSDNGKISYEGSIGDGSGIRLISGKIRNIRLRITTLRGAYELNYSPAEISSEKFINY